MSVLEYIHDKNIVHRDLKPGIIHFLFNLENILIDEMNNLETIRVADFGLSTEFGESHYKALS